MGRSHLTVPVGVAHFGSIVSDRLTTSSEELPSNMIIVLLL